MLNETLYQKVFLIFTLIGTTLCRETSRKTTLHLSEFVLIFFLAIARKIIHFLFFWILQFVANGES